MLVMLHSISSKRTKTSSAESLNPLPIIEMLIPALAVVGESPVIVGVADSFSSNEQMSLEYEMKSDADNPPEHAARWPPMVT